MPEYAYLDQLPADFFARGLHDDVLRGLTAQPKSLPPKWFYDKAGSDLFEEITRLPEYYPTRAEREILAARSADVVAATAADTLIELGSGSSQKTRLLLDALVARAERPAYAGLDVSEDALHEACGRLAEDYPALRVTGIRADFEHGFERAFGALPDGGRRLVAFLGGTIGNFAPADRASFVGGLRAQLRPGDHFLLGADLVKDPAVLVPAYDDAQGVTAAFNRNVLEVLNAALGADFEPARFEHVALWDATAEWIEMRLRALGRQQVRIRDLDLDVDFADGEELRTEISAKFRREGLERELGAAGFAPAGWWTDEQGRFSLSLWAAG
jgi:L-histidine N-alpha-methyltransferase